MDAVSDATNQVTPPPIRFNSPRKLLGLSDPQAVRQPMYRLYRWFLARFRLDLVAVCEQSIGRGGWDDFHTRADAAGCPAGVTIVYCKRCQKMFYV